MIAVITESAISVDSTKSNAGGGRGLFLQALLLAWTL